MLQPVADCFDAGVKGVAEGKKGHRVEGLGLDLDLEGCCDVVAKVLRIYAHTPSCSGEVGAGLVEALASVELFFFIVEACQVWQGGAWPCASLS